MVKSGNRRNSLFLELLYKLDMSTTNVTGNKVVTKTVTASALTLGNTPLTVEQLLGPQGPGTLTVFYLNPQVTRRPYLSGLFGEMPAIGGIVYGLDTTPMSTTGGDNTGLLYTIGTVTGSYVFYNPTYELPTFIPISNWLFELNANTTYNSQSTSTPITLRVEVGYTTASGVYSTIANNSTKLVSLLPGTQNYRFRMSIPPTNIPASSYLTILLTPTFGSFSGAAPTVNFLFDGQYISQVTTSIVTGSGSGSKFRVRVTFRVRLRESM